MTRLAPAPEMSPPEVASHLLGFDHLHWWVGNARHTAHFLCSGFGFDVTAYAGPETGMRDRHSYVLEQGAIRFVVTNALDPDSEMAEAVRLHGDGVHEVAYLTDDVTGVFGAVTARGARPASAPRRHEDRDGTVVTAGVGAYGDTVHTLVERGAYRGRFLPGYEERGGPGRAAGPGGGPTDGTGWPAPGLRSYDHVVANVEEHRLDQWVDWYERVWGLRRLQHFSEDDVSTSYSALRSTVVGNGGPVVQPINEPAPGLRRSQIEEYLDYYRGPGVQHVALRTDDIIGAVASLRARGIRFLGVPDAYYDEAPRRLPGIDLPWARLAELGILVDRDAHGHLLQIFTENVASRPTVFLEIIQRVGARGFGEGNFKALFTAIEAEQARRGNL